MIKPVHKPRLKGLDEMPSPRRTLRQRYFAARSRIQASGLLRWMWAFLKVAIVLLLMWGIARLMGLPIEQQILNFLPT